MFCDNWQQTLNVKKTKTMVVQQNTSQVSPFIDIKGDVIQNVTEYKFLGCLFKHNGNIIRRSSANAREPTLKFKSSGGRHSSVLKLALRSFMKILKRVGLIESPCSYSKPI
jgi:phage terminase small subunit